MSASSPRRTPIGIARAARTAVLVAVALSGFGSAAHAQSLLELYDAAHSFDATYLSARETSSDFSACRTVATLARLKSGWRALSESDRLLLP